MSARILQGPKRRHFVEEKTLGQFFFNRCEKFGNRTCQIDGTDNRTETYASVRLRSVRLAIALQKRGVKPQDIITLCCNNTLDTIIPILAGSFLGAITTNLEASLSVKHTKHLLSLVSPKIIFVVESAVKLIEESLEGTNSSPEIIVFGQSNKYSMFSDLIKTQEEEEEFQPTIVDPDDLCWMFFSSGTTGLPKAICHSHNSLLFSCTGMYEYGVRHAALHFTTFYWMTAICVLLASFQDGSYRVFCRNPTAEDVFRIISQYKVESIFFAPILTYKLTSYPNSKNYDTSSVKVVMCGGTPMAPSQLQKVRDLFKSAFVTVGYGMSEIGVVSCFDPNSDRELAYNNTKLKSCGKPALELKMKVVGLESEELLAPNQKGEFRIVSPGLMKGYHKLDSSQVFDRDGFLKTGDIGYYDEDGCIYLIDRIKEMFKYQSWHIVPSLLEAVLLEHPDVQEAVVFGVPKDEEGEVPAACVVLKEGSSTTEDIVTFFEKRVADREKLRGGIRIFKELPKTPSGKVARNQIKNLVLNPGSK